MFYSILIPQKLSILFMQFRREASKKWTCFIKLWSPKKHYLSNFGPFYDFLFKFGSKKVKHFKKHFSKCISREARKKYAIC